MSLFNPSRDQVRQFFFNTWALYSQHKPLSDLEKIALEVIQMHPEYHGILSHSEQVMDSLGTHRGTSDYLKNIAASAFYS